MTSRASRSNLILGALLLVLGLLFLLNNFNLLPANFVAWWPGLVRLAGAGRLGRGLVGREGASLVAGSLVAAGGGFWLLDNLGRADTRLFFPVLVIALGVGLLLRSLLAAR